MIARDLARALRSAGLVWRPQAGDAFQLLDTDMDATGTDLFFVSDLMIEAHDYPSGTVLGFNGTTEWALDSVALEDALWFPREDQLRAALKSTFVRLERGEDGDWVVHTVFLGEPRVFHGRNAETAYGLAVLDEVRNAAA